MPLAYRDESQLSNEQFIEKKYVSGLSSLSLYFSNEYKKRILILVNPYFESVLCEKSVKSITADIFLYGLHDEHERTKLLDVFIESEYYFKGIDDLTYSKHMKYNKPSYPNFMHNVRKSFEQICLVIDQKRYNKGCLYNDIARFHLIDLNSKFMIIKYLVELKVFFDNILKKDNTDQFIKNIEENKKVFNKFKYIYQTDESIKNALSEFFKDSENDTLIQQIGYPSIKQFLTDKINIIIEEDYTPITVDKLIKYTDQIITDTNFHIIVLYILMELRIQTIINIMSIYTIANIQLYII